MMVWVIIWLIVGFVGGGLCVIDDYLKKGYITTGDVLTLIPMSFLGPIALAIGLDWSIRRMLKKLDWSFMDKKLFVKKKEL